MLKKMRHHQRMIATLALLCCLQVAAGRRTDGECDPGSYAETEGSSCSRCAVGYFQPERGQAGCLPCPTGTFNDQEGQSSIEACLMCPAGTYSNHASRSCSQCPAGQYQPSTGQHSCIQTSPGYYTRNPGATSQVACPAGHEQSHSGASSCRQCPAGHAAQSGASSCTKCGAGQYAPAGSAGCMCRADFELASGGTGPCTHCPGGALARKDIYGCYRKIQFARCTASGLFRPEYACEKAYDNKRDFPNIFISQHSGATRWNGFFAGPTRVRKLVLWRRPDCCTNQFDGIKVYYMTDHRYRLCGTVPSGNALYKIFDCSHDAALGVVLLRGADYDKWISVAEVEAYTD